MAKLVLWVLLALAVKAAEKLMEKSLEMRLVKACRRDDRDLVSKLLEVGADPTWDQNASLRVACDKGHDEIVTLLLADERVKPTEPDNRALRQAATAGHTSIVLRLLSIDHPLLKADAVTEAFRLACSLGHVDLAAALINNQLLDINRQIHSGSGRTCLLGIALINGFAKIAQMIIKHPQINMNPKYVEPMVSEAAKSTECLQLLLEDGRSNPAAGSNKAVTRAVHSRCLRNLELLIADKRVKCWDNDSAALCAALKYGQMNMAKLLLKHSPQLIKGQMKILSELNLAVRYKYEGSVEILKMVLRYPEVCFDSQDIQEALPRNFYQAVPVIRVIKDGTDEEVVVSDTEVAEWALACSFRYMRPGIFGPLLRELLKTPQLLDRRALPIIAGLQSMLTFLACNRSVGYHLPQEIAQVIVTLGLPYLFDY